MRIRSIFLLVALALVALLVAACGGEDPTPTPRPTPTVAAPTATPTTPAPSSAGTPTARATPTPAPRSTPAPTPTPSKSALDLLVEEAAAADDKQVVGHYDGTDPATIRAWEDAFEAEYGIDITVASIPGHASRDAPVQALQAYLAGKALVDDLGGNVDLLLDLQDRGGLRKPNWEALYGVSPRVRDYREGLSGVSTYGGEPFNDYCMVSSFYVWPLAYNSNNVTAEELDGITFDDLAFDPVWKDRVITDARFLGVYAFPMAPGWDDARQLAWVAALRDNGAKAVSGGSTGVVQALLSGEGDIAIASATTALREKDKGAPVDWAPVADGWLPGGIGLSCFTTLTATDAALADLWATWQATKGTQLQADLTGSFVTAPGVVNDFTQKLTAAGLDLPANLVYAATAENIANLGRWRQQAIDTFTGQ